MVVSEKGWLRAMKGHLTDHSALTFKEGDSLKLAFHAQTTDKVLVFTTGGKFYTIGADRLPGGRGHGEPIRIIVDMDNDQDIVTAFVHDARAQAAARLARGQRLRRARGSEVVANTRKGKQVMNVQGARRGRALRSGHRATTSPLSAKTARCWCSRSPRYRKWARQGRSPAEVQGWRRRSTSRPSTLASGPVLAGFGRPHLRQVARGTRRMDRRPRLGRTHGAEGVPAHWQVRIERAAGSPGLARS